MSPFANLGLLLVNTVGSLLLMVVLLRFLLQLVRADFYNPISQFVVKVTSPILTPLRRIIPGFGGLDIAALVLAYLVQVLVIAAIVGIAFTGFSAIPWGSVLLWAPVGIATLLLDIYFWGLIITIVASWIAPNSYNPALILINQILEPVIRPIRSKMPDLGGIDLSPIVVFLLIQVIEILLLHPLAQALAIPRGVINL